MTSLAAVEPLLANSMRVLRNKTNAGDLIAAYPTLKAKALASPATLTEPERRLLLDLPDEDEEAANIAAVTNLSRSQLIVKAVSDRSSLTKGEALLLKDRFWTPSPTEEVFKYFMPIGSASKELLDGHEAVRERAYFPNEKKAIENGLIEICDKDQVERNAEQHAKAEPVLTYAKEWIQHLYREGKPHWGFIYLYDAAAQKLDPVRLDAFERHLEDFFMQALLCNGSRDIIDLKWTMVPFNAPKTAFAPTSIGNDNDAASEYHGGAILRRAFRDILENPEAYQKAEDVTPVDLYSKQYANSIATSGVLTNTFLVIDPVCIDSVLDGMRLFDDMRVLAFEVDFPVKGRQYAEGYQGFTWVRMDQLVYNFYELRLVKAEEVGMDDIWKASQSSMHGAFVSMDAEEDSWTDSGGIRGFTHDSVLGKGRAARKQAREDREG